MQVSSATRRLWIGLGLVTIAPLIAIAALSGWLLQAEREALAMERRALAEDRARRAADKIADHLQNAISERQDALLSTEASGGVPALRGAVGADPLIAMATLHDADDNAIFPVPGTMLLFYESQVMSRVGLALSSARRRLTEETPFLWAGSALEDGPGAIACRLLSDERRICLAFDGETLRGLVREVIERTLTSGAVALIDQAGFLREAAAREPLVALPSPLAGWHLGSTDEGQSSTDWTWRALIIGLVVAIALGGAVAVYGAQSSFAAEARRRITMLAQISHELRTPLANLRLYSALLDGLSERKEARAYCAVIDQEAERLSHMIDNALIAAKASEAVAAPTEIASPDDVVRTLLARFRPLWPEGSSSVTLDLSASTLARFDVQALERILINLLDNARRHAPGAAISVRTAFEQDALVLSVEDDGDGALPELQSSLFDAFATSRPDGFGLGLATCRLLAEAGGGGIAYYDRAPGAGFVVRLKADREIALPEEALCAS